MDSTRRPLPHRQAIIGQDRAVKALRFGLGNRAPGFNVYVSTPDAEDKLGIIQQFLDDLTRNDPIPADWCYVNNFEDPYHPNALMLPAGRARELKEDISQFITEARQALIKTFESEEYGKKQNAIKQELGKKQQHIFTEINEQARDKNFVIRQTPMEILVIPLRNGQLLDNEAFQELSEEEKTKILNTQREIQAMLQSAARKSRELEKATARELNEVEQKAALFAIEDLLEELRHKYEGILEVPQFLEDLKQDILANLPLFLQDDQSTPAFGIGDGVSQKAITQRYEVNVLVDNSALSNAPIIVELNPTYNNLFGKIERESIMGTLVTNFTLIRPGALHMANGGYLILPVVDLLTSPFAWDNLKRALRNQRIDIEDPTEKLGFISAKSLKPEPIPLHLQIILIGHPELFYLLYQYDPDFKKLFKIKADFDPVMPATQDLLEEVCGYIHALGEAEKLLPVQPDALARLIEYSHRIAGDQQKMTTQLEEIADILREANFYAQAQKAENIGSAHVQSAIEEKKYRSDLLQEKIREMIHKRVLFIDLKGEKVGQVNGLSVIDLGDIAFGQPSRITAAVSMGKEGIIDIEREAKLGGPIHTKGVLILTGFLYDKFGQDTPLNLAVRLVFEQNYGGVEGDSASSTELYAILSSLSNLPIRQGIAVTGSVNQKGEVQAIGGVNEKIEGFFEVCKLEGLTGEQGVIIPASNTTNLMLKEEVVEASKNGQFHVWAIDTIEEGIEILTGAPAGKAMRDPVSGRLVFEKDTVYGRVQARLQQMNDNWKVFASEAKEE